MDDVLKFLKECGTYYLATVDADGNPQVRPFGTITKFEDALYIQTGNVKDCFKQMMAHPRIAISAMSSSGGEWIRIEADAVQDDRREAREALLNDYPHLRGLYSEDDGNCEAVKLTNVKATFCSFTAEPRMVEF
ncbi:MAG: pyridoxamine 5'-phosphate oxidase family protein [Eggerthellaceae bacterium]|nr:pyridoxamine 5'-phosphate oxidase family protein [Eggerthellaceae bacterium]